MSIPFEDYRAIEAVNFSTLKAIHKSPAHYRHALMAPRQDTTRLLLGRAVHTAVLEPDRFPLDYVVFDGSRRAGKAWDEFCEINDGKGVLKAEEYRLCLAIRDSVRSHPRASRLLVDGEAETTHTWRDEVTGIDCKCRMDWLAPGHLADLKTAASTDPWEFAASSARYLYHCQHAFYEMAVPECDLEHYTIAVEMEPPHDVAVFHLPEWVMDEGRLLVREWLDRLAWCRERDQWPGRCEHEQDLDLPKWAIQSEDSLGITIGGLDV